MNIHEIANKMFTKLDTAKLIKKFISFLPNVEVEYSLKPIASTILKCSLIIHPNFYWSPHWHLASEPFSIIIDDESEILHYETFLITKN